MTRTYISSFCVLASLTAAAHAGYGVVEATGAFQLPGGNSLTYVSEVGAAYNPRVQGYNFGSVDSLAGQTLQLQNWYFENYAYNGGAGSNNWLSDSSNATLRMVISQGATQVSLTDFTLNQDHTDFNNRFWQLALLSRGTNVAAGLANGSYSVSYEVNYTYNIWDGSSASVGSASTGASTGTFTVVPAPGALALLGVAGLVGARKRR
ncbi:MAG: hypothetical protein NT059_07975 [Planctomycetota bacterium]|nr:hypothetical protein [Planctomycetota bacterium]